MEDDDSDVEVIESFSRETLVNAAKSTFPKVILRRMSEQEWIKVPKQEPKDPDDTENIPSHDTHAVGTDEDRGNESLFPPSKTPPTFSGSPPLSVQEQVADPTNSGDPIDEGQEKSFGLPSAQPATDQALRVDIALIKELPPLLHQNQLKKDPSTVPEPIDEIMGKIPETKVSSL